jgi:hypothetical protein
MPMFRRRITKVLEPAINRLVIARGIDLGTNQIIEPLQGRFVTIPAERCSMP